MPLDRVESFTLAGAEHPTAIPFCFATRNAPSAGNALTSIPDGYFRTLPNLTAIDVSFNDGDSTGIQITTALAY